MSTDTPRLFDDEYQESGQSAIITDQPHLQKQTGFLRLWYYLTVPAYSSNETHPEESEKVRRGQLTSAMLLVVILCLVLATPVAILGSHRLQALLLCFQLILAIIALLFNRLGKPVLAGILIVVGIDIGIGFSIITIPGGFSAYVLPLFDFLVVTEFVAASLLSPRSVFALAFLHSLFIWGCVALLPQTSKLARTLPINGYGATLQAVTLQIIVAVVTYFFVASTQQAISRAEHEKEVAQLKKREFEWQQWEIEQKRQLDIGIQQILHTHMQVANGDFSIRAPLTQDNVLWRIAYSLNNLLARLQRLSQVEQEFRRLRTENIHLSEILRETSTTQYELRRIRAENIRLAEALHDASDAQNELQRTKDAAVHLTAAVQRARAAQQSFQVPHTGTIIDEVILGLMAKEQ